MMAGAIRPIPCQRFERVLKRVGCHFVHQRGDHRKWDRSDLKRSIIIPAERELPVFIIQNCLRILRLSHEEYLKILSEL